MRISADDKARVETAIRDAETRAGAEFVCVLLRRASFYEVFPLAWASLVALVLPWPLLWLTVWPVIDLLLAQLVAFAALVLLLGWEPVRRHVVPRRLQRATAHRAAAEQFLIRDLASTPNRRGVLLFVAHEERYARVLADDGAANAVPAEQWRNAVDRLVSEARQGRPADGFVAALGHCADVLQVTSPASGALERANALPNRFVVLD